MYMKVEIISIGDELLIGRTINTNAAWIGEQLSLIGFSIARVTTISDSRNAIIDAVTKAYTEHDVVIITGGLGPTNDDITKHVLCELFSCTLTMHKEAYRTVESFVRSLNGEMNENNKNQALFPDKAEFIPNTCGTASGMWFTHNNAIIISLPGVPFEMKDMMTQSVIPKLAKTYTLPVIVHEHINITGIHEAKLAEIIAPWEQNLPTEINLAYLPSPGIVRLRLTCIAKTQQDAKTHIQNAISELQPYIETHIYGYGLSKIEEIVGELLHKNSLTISTAESCTGGAIAKSITSISGSSHYFIGSIVAYNNTIKSELLHVSTTMLQTHGAVSKIVVEAMAQNCRKIHNTDFAIATSGIAGPTGGTADKPIGTVWIAISHKNGTHSQMYNFGNNRKRTITKTVITALNTIRLLIENKL